LLLLLLLPQLLLLLVTLLLLLRCLRPSLPLGLALWIVVIKHGHEGLACGDTRPA
jgi:hypothetical protein